MSLNSKLPSSFLEKCPFGEEGDDIWVATAFSLKRNLRRYLFPNRLDAATADQITPVLMDAVVRHPKWHHPVFLPGKKLESLDKEYLFEHFLFLEGFDHLAPEYGFIVDDQGALFCSINVKDHLGLRYVDFRNQFDEGYKALFEMEKGLAKELELAVSPRFGFLTASLDEAGTGFFVTAYLHLPALVHTGKLVELMKQMDEGVVVSSMEGSVEHPPGDLITITNRYTLGVSEDLVAALVRQTALNCVKEERELREELKNGAHIEIKDLISRNAGLLLHSYQMETKEALLALSLTALGLDLGLCSGVEKKKLLRALEKVRRAHLCHEEKESDLSDLPERRSKFLHRYLSGLVVK